MQISSKQPMVFQFASRSHGHLEKPLKLCIAASTATFRDVCADRRPSAPDLGNNSKDFMLGKISCQGVAVLSKFMCFFPDFQIAEVFHRLSLAFLFGVERYIIECQDREKSTLSLSGIHE